MKITENFYHNGKMNLVDIEVATGDLLTQLADELGFDWLYCAKYRTPRILTVGEILQQEVPDEALLATSFKEYLDKLYHPYQKVAISPATTGEHP